MSIRFDTSEFDRGVERLKQANQNFVKKAILTVANEILRLSQYEVPHDKGLLQNSGRVQPLNWEKAEVGYNKVYAARLHEHPEYNFQKGRKGKYLEDPIKHNLRAFQKYFGQTLGGLYK